MADEWQDPVADIRDWAEQIRNQPHHTPPIETVARKSRRHLELERLTGSRVSAPADVQQTILRGMKVGYSETEATQIVVRHLRQARAHPTRTPREALDRAWFDMASAGALPDSELPGPPRRAVYLGWPIHSRSVGAEIARIGLALRLALTPRLIWLLDRWVRIQRRWRRNA